MLILCFRPGIMISQSCANLLVCPKIREQFITCMLKRSVLMLAAEVVCHEGMELGFSESKLV